eukprot:767922-Hanusia_phi.AAC.2
MPLALTPPGGSSMKLPPTLLHLPKNPKSSVLKKGRGRRWVVNDERPMASSSPIVSEILLALSFASSTRSLTSASSSMLTRSPLHAAGLRRPIVLALQVS